MTIITRAELQILLTDIYNIPVQFTENQLIERISDRYRWPLFYRNDINYPTLERIDDNGNKVQDFFYKDGFIEAEKLIDFYHQGYTIILSGVQYLLKDIATISSRITQTVKKEIDVNCYFSKGEKIVSFPKHNHEYPVIVKNAFGISTWEINGETQVLKNNDIFFIDRYINHHVTQIGGVKCSLTFNLM
jgi:hypothetical protein